MLVQAEVVPWWGTGRPAEFSPSGSNPSRARIGGYDYKTESFQRPRAEHYTRFREMRNSNFFGAPSPGGRSVREITSREETERLPENRLGRSTAPEQVWQAPGLREFQARRVPADPTADRKPRACQ